MSVFGCGDFVEVEVKYVCQVFDGNYQFSVDCHLFSHVAATANCKAVYDRAGPALAEGVKTRYGKPAQVSYQRVDCHLATVTCADIVFRGYPGRRSVSGRTR